MCVWQFKLYHSESFSVEFSFVFFLAFSIMVIYELVINI